MRSVILLNADYSFLNTISVRRALILLNNAKVHVLEFSDKIISGVYESWFAPKILRLVKLVRMVYRNKVPWSPKNVVIRDNFKCQYCGKILTMRTSECEHVLPQSRGGKDTFENTVCACRECNQRKADKLPSEVGMRLLRQPYQPTIMEFIQLRLKNTGIEDILNELYRKVS